MEKTFTFVPNKVSGFNNWLTDALQGRRAIAIDRFQRIREIGYLGNPNGFTGTYISYVAHEPVYFNSEWNNLYEPEDSYDEVVIFEKELYSGWWGATISKEVTFPSDEELSDYSGMSIELLRDVLTVDYLMVVVLKLNVAKILIIVIMAAMIMIELQECIYAVDNAMKQFI